VFSVRRANRWRCRGAGPSQYRESFELLLPAPRPARACRVRALGGGSRHRCDQYRGDSIDGSSDFYRSVRSGAAVRAWFWALCADALVAPGALTSHPPLALEQHVVRCRYSGLSPLSDCPDGTDAVARGALLGIRHARRNSVRKSRLCLRFLKAIRPHGASLRVAANCWSVLTTAASGARADLRSRLRLVLTLASKRHRDSDLRRGRERTVAPV